MSASLRRATDLSAMTYAKVGLPRSITTDDQGRHLSLGGLFVCDLNADGYDDVLATANDGKGLGTTTALQIRLLISDGATLVDRTAELGAVGVRTVLTRDAQFGDFNNDGIIDIFLSNHGTESVSPFPGEQNRLLLSSDAGYFDATPSLPALTDFSHGSTVGDFDGDGNLDIYVNNLGEDDGISSYFLFGDGAGGFDFGGYFQDVVKGLARSFIQGGYAAAADFNADGLSDVFTIPTRWPDYFWLDRYFVSVGDGGFKLSTPSLPDTSASRLGSRGFQDMHVVDLENDGDPDVIGYDTSPMTGQKIIVYANNGDGTFSFDAARVPAGLPATEGVVRISAADFNLDGFTDLFHLSWKTGFSGNASFYLENDGTGHFHRKDWAVPAIDGATAVLDVDRNGLPDFLNWDYLGNLALYVANVDDLYAGSQALPAKGVGTTIHGSDRDDVFIVFGSGMTLVGGSGQDTALFRGPRSSFEISKIGGGYLVGERAGSGAAQVLTSIERVEFSDGIFPLETSRRSGAPEYGKDHGFLFDGVFYLLANPGLAPAVTLEGALEHYLGSGAAQGCRPNNWFDPGYYARRWADLAEMQLSDATLFMHYNLYGVWEGRSAGPTFDRFDGNRYLADWPDVAAYVDANLDAFLGSRTNGSIAHFIIYGADEQRVAYSAAGVPIDMGYVV